jgi:P-type Cu+ transporter
MSSSSLSSSCGCGCDPYTCNNNKNGSTCNCDHPSCECKTSTQQVELVDTTTNNFDIETGETTATVDIAIGGMTCSMCSSAVEKAISQLDGVIKISVSLATNLATIVYNPHSSSGNSITPQVLADEIEDIGYDVTDIFVRTPALKKKTATTTISTENNKRSVRTVEITIGGMTCSMCSSAVHQALIGMSGVENAHVSLATNTARVRYYADNGNGNGNETGDGSCTTPELLREMIEDIGYEVADVILEPLSSSEILHQRQNNNNSNNITARQPPQQTSNYEYDDDDRLGRILRQQDIQLQTRRRNFLWSLLFVIPILCTTMVIPEVFPDNSCIRQFLEQDVVLFGHKTILVQAFVVWLLTTPIQFVCGYSFYKTSYHGIMRGVLGMDVLVCVGTTSSYVYAFIAMLMNDPGYRFFETSAVLICFVLLGKWMNAMAVRRTSEALTQLMSLQPKTCLKVTPNISSSDINKKKMMISVSDKNTPYILDLWNPLEDTYTEEVVPIQAIHPGDIVKVLKGSSIPADGVVLHGEMTVDQSMITGESIPVLKEPGDDVLGGTICCETGMMAFTTITGPQITVGKNESPFHRKSKSNSSKNNKNPLTAATFVKVTGVGSESALSQIVQLVQEAQTRQVPIQSMADNIASVFVPVVVTFAFVTFVAWYCCCVWGIVPQHWYGDESPATFSLLFGIAALVISCPCALGLATPTGTLVENDPLAIISSKWWKMQLTVSTIFVRKF